MELSACDLLHKLLEAGHLVIIFISIRILPYCLIETIPQLSITRTHELVRKIFGIHSMSLRFGF